MKGLGWKVLGCRAHLSGPASRGLPLKPQWAVYRVPSIGPDVSLEPTDKIGPVPGIPLLGTDYL